MVQARKKYTKANIDTLLNLLHTYQSGGKKIEYEVFVDGFKVIPRTANVELFKKHEASVQSDTQEIQVVVYTGRSQYNDKYTYYLGEETHTKPQNSFGGLAGFGDFEGQSLGEILDKKIKEERRAWETDLLKDKLTQKEEKIAELKQEIEGLESTIEQMKGERSPFHSVAGNLGGIVVDAFFKRNPKLLDGVLGAIGADAPQGAVAGVAPRANEADAPQGAGADAASIKQEETPGAVAIIKEKDRFDTLAAQMRKDFTAEEEKKMLFKMIGFFSRDRASLKSICEQVYPNLRNVIEV